MDSIKKKNIFIIVGILLIIVAGILWFTAIQNKKEIKEDTISYLTEKGYDTDKDIKDIYIVNMGEDKVINTVVVTFKDEPDIDYLYSYEKEINQIMQIDGVSKKANESLKHLED